MVLDPLGPNLEDNLNSCNGKFSLKTVLLLADQFISRIQSIHERFFIHRDIKPNTFHMGFGVRGNQVNIIDFRFAKQYRDPKTKDHIAFRENKKLIGAVRYASINSHLGIGTCHTSTLHSFFFKADLRQSNLAATIWNLSDMLCSTTYVVPSHGRA
jgi:serine/threonine protein kinase